MSGEDSLHDLLDDAEALMSASPEKAIVLLEQVAMAEVSPKAEEDIKCKEIATLKLGKLQAKKEMANGKIISYRASRNCLSRVASCDALYVELGDLIRKSRRFLPLYSKAKAAKIVRELVDNFLNMKSSTGIEVR